MAAASQDPKRGRNASKGDTMRILKDNPLTRLIGAIKGFAEDPLSSLGTILPAAIMITGIVSGILAYIGFITDGEYQSQLDVIRADGFFQALNSNFTNGTAGDVTSGWAGILLTVLVAAQLILFAVILWKRGGLPGRIVIVLDLIAAVVWGVFFFTVMGIRFGENVPVINRQFAIDTLNGLYEKGHDINAMARIYLIAGMVIVLILALCAFLVKDARRAFLDLVIAVIFTWLLIPIVLLILENIFSLGSAAVLFLIVLIAGKFFLSFLSGEGGESGGGSSGGSHAHKAPKADAPSKAPEKKESSGPAQKRFDIGFETKIWRDKGGLGIATASADSVYFKNNIDAPQWICTVQQFEQGDVAVYMNNRRITDVAGCKKPAR